jgi:cold shock CspA family protein
LIAGYSNEGNMMLGTVSAYYRLKGFGFIVPDDPTLPDFFTAPKFMLLENKHHRFLFSGQRVSFDPTDVETRPTAINVRLVKPITIAVQRRQAVKP